MSEEYIVCRCGARFTNSDEGKKLYDKHQAWCGKQGMNLTESSKRTGRRKQT
ncbi:MAG: hypothetical protein ABSD41_00030 [Candidatus Bathyarchaeia archaeon]